MKSKLALLGLAAIFAMPAKADETLKFRQVQHFTWTQSQPTGIPDGSNHLIGIASPTPSDTTNYQETAKRMKNLPLNSRIPSVRRCSMIS
jgi:hypothetical protein